MSGLRLGPKDDGDGAEAPKPEPAKDSAPKGGRGKTVGGAAVKNPTVNLEKSINEAFDVIVGGLYFVDETTAKWTETKAPQMAHAWAEWAKANPKVARFLEASTSGAAAANAIGVTAIWAGGCYMIYLSKRQALPETWAMGAGFLGVPVSSPVFPDEVSPSDGPPPE